jgi:pyruvate/2-oxoglutarate/acetoin dehydrogenase E1 component
MQNHTPFPHPPQVQEVKGHAEIGRCLPIHKCHVTHRASDESVAAGKAVTVLTYLHGVHEVLGVLSQIQDEGLDIDLIEMRSLKPLDMEVCAAPAACLIRRQVDARDVAPQPFPPSDM